MALIQANDSGATARALINTSLTLTQAITASAAELNILDGATLTVTELNYVDGVTSAIQTQLDSKLASATAASTYQPLDADLTTLAGLTATTDNFIVSVASAWASRTPAQVKTTLSLNLVENTALSTWAGTSNITTLGTISTGTWSGTTIAVAKGGTGLTSLGTGLQVLRTNAGATAMEWATISAGGGDLLASNNLSDLVSASTARTNLGLGNVDNTSDANKPVSTATQTALNLKANLISPSFTTPTLGVATATSINKVAITAPATGSTLTIQDGFTLTVTGNASVTGTNTGNETLSSINALAITTVGTVTSGTWTGTAIAAINGGTGFTTYATGDLIYASASNTLSKLAAGTNGHVLTLAGGVPTWAAGGGGGGSTFADNAFQVYDSVDNTKILAFEAGSITTATTRTLTIPDASGTIVLNDNTATLSSKTLTTPTIVDGGSIIDGSGNKYLGFEQTASAVNYWSIYNNATAGSPFLMPEGSDTNIGGRIRLKGTGAFIIDATSFTGGNTRGAGAVDLQPGSTGATQVASGSYSFAANRQNTASATSSFAIGSNTTASGDVSVATGVNCVASGSNTFVGGSRTRATMATQWSWSGGMHSTGGQTGDNQYTMLVARRYITGVTTGQTGITLYLNDGTSTEIIPDVTSMTYRTWTVRVRWNVIVSAITAPVTGIVAGDTVGGEDIIIIKKTGSTVTVVETSLGTVYGDTNLKTGLSMGYTASGTNFRINLVAPTFAGGGSLTLKSNAVLQITENGY